MKSYNHLFVSWGNLKEFIDDLKLAQERTVLVRIHSGIHTETAMRAFAAEVQRLLPQAVITGCSTSHVICEGRIYEKVCLISITTLGDGTLWSSAPECVAADGTQKPEELLCREITDSMPEEQKEGLMLAFFPPAYNKTRGLVQQMNQQCPNIKMIGGKAANICVESTQMQENIYVIAGTQADARHLSIVCISAPELYLYENVVCGVEGASKLCEATKVSGTMLDEVDGMDAAEWYEGMLDREELFKEPSLAGVFPLVPEDMPDIAYNVGYNQPTATNKRSRIKLFMEIDEGTRFSLGYFDPQKIVNQLNETYQELRKRPVEVLFAYDCMARMWMLHDCAKWEIGQFYTTNINGAMLAGEISYLNGRNTYANSTFVIAGLSENKDAHLYLKGKTLKNASRLQHENVKMMNYLLTTGTRQLNRQLQIQQEKMQRAMFFHEILELENETKYRFDCEREKLSKLAVFVLDNEQLLLLFMGQSAFLKELKEQYKTIQRSVEESGMRMYSYEAHGMLIVSDDTIEDEDFVARMEDIHNHLNALSYHELTFSYRCALVMNEKDALQKAQTALSYGEKNKKQLVRYSEVNKEVRDAKEEICILQVMRDALLEDRVIPYFQGIYDNRQKKIDMYEALIRIKDAQGRLYYPNQFLPVAKKYNLYEVLSTTMVKKVMELFADKDTKVTINLNVQDIYNRDMLKIIFRYLKTAKHPENYIFELVESEEVQDYEFVKQFADSIHEYGAKIAIDDFGSGFSNLLHILRIDADILKIDGEIIKDVCHDKKCLEFVAFINSWCTSQQKDVVGEYVENQDIQQKLKKMEISYSQGYYFAKPEPWQD